MSALLFAVYFDVISRSIAMWKMKWRLISTLECKGDNNVKS